MDIETRTQMALQLAEDYKEQNGLSQNKMAKLLGISSTVLSQLMSGTYKGNVEGMIKVIEDYFSVAGQAEETYHEVAYAETSISTKVYDVIRLAHIKGGLAICSGDAGIGKTKAAKKYVEDNPTNSIYISLNPCLTSIKAILKLLAAKVGARQERSLDDAWLSIAEKLSDKMVIIFDEAQHLPYKPIEMLRAFSDYFTDNGKTLGIVFIGNPETVRRLGAKQKAEFAQIANRTKQKLVYTVKQIKREDIELLFPILKTRDMDAEIDFLWGIAQTQQALRGAVNLFSNAYDNNNYSLNGLIAMAKHMELDLTGLNTSEIKKKRSA